jgi:hypothetical protein
MKTEQTKVNRHWTASEERQILELRAKGMSPEQIAQTVGRTADSIKGRLTQARLAERKRKAAEQEGIQGRYLVKMTNFETSRVVTYKEVLIAEHGNSSHAWDYTMRVIKRLNKKSAKNKVEEFYWVKYL